MYTKRFSEISDIDFAIDIVDIEKLDRATREEITQCGRLVYERAN
ncbi:MAG: hypothetical protein ACOCZB_09045 [Spirochaetota bacterium]